MDNECTYEFKDYSDDQLRTMIQRQTGKQLAESYQRNNKHPKSVMARLVNEEIQRREIEGDFR